MLKINGVLRSIIVLMFVVNSTIGTGQEFEVLHVNENIKLVPVGENLFVHTSYHSFPGFGTFPSNGVVLVKNGKALLIDTPNTNNQTEELAKFLNDSLQVQISKVIICHYHSDCLGGLEYLHSQGVTSIANKLTISECKKRNLVIPQISFEQNYIIDFYGDEIECNYFGPGHTEDNIIVFFSKQKVLFGGCLLKSMDSNNLGNIREADIDSWNETVNNILETYSKIKYVVPGHGNFGDISLLQHTIDLVEQAKIKSSR